MMRFLGTACILVLLAVPAAATQAPRILPEQFLRAFDPVTVFFPVDTGPARGGAELQPQRWLTERPEHPGAWRWINARTLQFRPADPWPPLTTVRFRTAGTARELLSLLPAPSRVTPRAGGVDLEAFEQIRLTFDRRVPLAGLGSVLRIDQGPLPGSAGGDHTSRLPRSAYTLKALERAPGAKGYAYAITLNRGAPFGTRTRLTLDLSGGRGLSLWRRVFDTAPAFNLVDVGCGERRAPADPAPPALRCNRSSGFDIAFSAAPGPVDEVMLADFVRIQPQISDLSFRANGRRIEVRGRFAPDTTYTVSFVPAAITDRAGRTLRLPHTVSAVLAFPARETQLSWQRSQGVVERYGPKRLPISGRGYTRADLRIQRIDPRDRNFWPFPRRAVVTRDEQRPPGPGEAPGTFAWADKQAGAARIGAAIKALGTPQASRLVDLPLRESGPGARFGLDVGPMLSAAGGARAPGTYLLGLRRLGGDDRRQWLRLQVTDLSLDIAQSDGDAVLAVTSIASGEPVTGARIDIEGSARQGGGRKWRELITGLTNSDGLLAIAKGAIRASGARVRRVVVSHGDDRLVVDPSQLGEVFYDNLWRAESGAALQVLTGPPLTADADARVMCHVFTERPVYRPKHAVHIKGYLRRHVRGALQIVSPPADLLVRAGTGEEWRYPIQWSDSGSFYQKFTEAENLTGEFFVSLRYRENGANGGMRECAEASFRKEAYRLPRFEVQLTGAAQAALDRPFDVGLIARYYAGGQVSGQPVRWRVTQFPYVPSAPDLPGFRFSSDSRYAAGQQSAAQALLEREQATDAGGAAKLTIDPSLDDSAAPRRYVVEATVTGADDQQVTATREVVALPPFALGVKLPRVLFAADRLEPEIVVLDGQGAPLAGVATTVRLYRREWRSHLQATAFAANDARYTTETVDRPLAERRVVSADGPLPVRFDVERAGVYVVELVARDVLGRRIAVKTDMFLGGEQPVTWSRPPSRVVKLTADQPDYAPGDRARVVIESPFQNARALVVSESPLGNRYRWLKVSGGKAIFEVPIDDRQGPRMPVHVLLLRGRLPGVEPSAGGPDLGKPATLAATLWLPVRPRENRVRVTLRHAPSALPGDMLEVDIRLKDPDGRPLAGEVTLWLVDQAVLALGREARLDPLADFIPARQARVRFFDTRNKVFGYLPFSENPGGGAGAGAGGSLLDDVSLRRNFSPVPYFNPNIRVGADGHAMVRVQLPDNLTNFKLRAKAVSGARRFGFARGHLRVRLPVLVQPTTPRFVRFGDRPLVSAIARVVEGAGGAGRIALHVSGAALDGPAERSIDWRVGAPARFDFALKVPQAGADELVLKLAASRDADGAYDGFESRLPVRDDALPRHQRISRVLDPGERLRIPALDAVRAGAERRLLLSADPAGSALFAALNFLVDYPFGCTEQRISRARAGIAAAGLASLWPRESARAVVRDTLAYLPGVVDEDDLVAFWPGARGRVALTAWTVSFMTEAGRAGYRVDADLLRRLEQRLERALRSDDPGLSEVAAFSERAMALGALAEAGRAAPGYAAELARQARFLDVDAAARALRALHAQGAPAEALGTALADDLWSRVRRELRQGQTVYAGLAEGDHPSDPVILPGEVRSMATLLRAFTAIGQKQRARVLRSGLLELAGNTGWGSTQANAAAVLALLDSAGSTAAPARASLNRGGRSETVNLPKGEPALAKTLGADETVEIVNSGQGRLAVFVASRFQPAQSGAELAAVSEGLVVTREWRRVGADGVPGALIGTANGALKLAVGDVVEVRVELVNPTEQYHVAMRAPLAAGMEVLNPALATAPPEATPAGRDSLAATYREILDDRVGWYFNHLPAGTYAFHYRVRAAFAGHYARPGAYAQLMYDTAVSGRDAGVWLNIAAVPGVEN